MPVRLMVEQLAVHHLVRYVCMAVAVLHPPSSHLPSHQLSGFRLILGLSGLRTTLHCGVQPHSAPPPPPPESVLFSLCHHLLLCNFILCPIAAHRLLACQLLARHLLTAVGLVVVFSVCQLLSGRTMVRIPSCVTAARSPRAGLRCATLPVPARVTWH